ncbi:VirD4-like conjugal transfer protein, CD1115 family [Priestia megaterium]|uniref:VirD4-like conjugal transfer protein, CD1115 family n=1 Tax=Priestia megaterium TaxID=1404 RepID=UPI003000B027
MANNKKRKLKKTWKSLLIVSVVLSLFLTYSVFALFYHIMNMNSIEFKFDEMLQTFTSVGDVFGFALGDPNLKLIFFLLPVLMIILLLYLRRDSLFEKQYDDASDFALHGSNKIEDPRSITNGKVLSDKNTYSAGDFKGILNNVEEGIVLGKVPNEDKLLIVHDKTEIDNKNVLVIGSSGSGKGQGYVIPNIINIRTQSLIVIDPKGENYRLTHQLKRDQGYKVYNIDFVNFSEAYYNPLDLILNDEDAQKVSKNIVQSSTKDGKEDFFSERAQKLLGALMVYVKATFTKLEANMDTLINEYNTNVKDPEKCDEFLDSLPVDHPAYGLLTSVLDGLAGNTRASVIASFDSAIAIFQLRRIKEMTKKSDFTFDEFQDGKSILYVKLQVPTNPYQALTSVFFTQMIDRFYMVAGQNPSGKLNVPVNFILDEFPNIGKIDGYSETLNTCRGLLIYMHTIIQDISQLQDDKLYGDKGARSVISAHDSQLILRVTEKESAKILSERFGKTTVKHKAESVSISKQGRSITKNDTFVERDVVTTGELLKMEKNEAYLLISGRDVMKIEKAYQFNVFGDLISKNREDNYHNSRKKLGYNTPLYNGNGESRNTAFSFEEYQRKNYGAKQKEQDREEKQEKQEVVKNKTEQVSENVSKEPVSATEDKKVEQDNQENTAQQEVAATVANEEKNEEVVKREVSQETNTTAEAVEEKPAIQIENVSESEINDFRKASQELAADQQEEENTVDEKLESIEYQTAAIETMLENENIADTVNKLFSAFDQLGEEQNINADNTQSLDNNAVSEKEETEDEIDSLFGDIGNSYVDSEENKSNHQSKKVHQEAELEDDFLPM